jgi:hypothetical protein
VHSSSKPRSLCYPAVCVYCSVVALAPVLSIVHRRMAERGGKQAELSTKYASCLPVLLSGFELVVQGSGTEIDVADDDLGASGGLEPEPTGEDGPGDAVEMMQLQVAGTLTVLVKFVKDAVMLASARDQAVTTGAETETETEMSRGADSERVKASELAREDETHLVRYLLFRFCLGMLGANQPTLSHFALPTQVGTRMI